MKERIYNVQDAFMLLKQYKITSNIESVRRWLRNGTIKGIEPSSRKQGWTVTETALNQFIAERMPDDFNTTNVVNETDTTVNKASVVLNEAAIRADEREKIWYELRSKYVVQDYIEIKKTYVKEAIEHRGYRKELLEEVWRRLVANNPSNSKKVSVYFLLDAISFEGQRILLDTHFTDRYEQAVYPIIEYVRMNKKSE